MTTEAAGKYSHVRILPVDCYKEDKGLKEIVQ